MEQTTPDRQSVHWRIPANVHAEVVAFAQRTHRSINGAANYLLELGLQAEKQESAR